MNKTLLGLIATAFAANAFAAASTAQVVAPQGATAATISAPVTAVAPAQKKWTASFVAETFAPARAAVHGTYDGYQAQNHVGLAYDLGNDKKIQYRQYFLYNMTEVDKTSTDEWSLGEHVVQLSDAKSFHIGSAPVATYARFYLPGADIVKEVGQYQLRVVSAVKQSFGKTTVEYALNNRFYAYTGEEDGQRGFRVLPAVGVEYALNSWMTPTAAVYTDHSFLHTGSGPGLIGSASVTEVKDRADNQDYLFVDVGSTFNLPGGVSINAYLEAGDDLRTPQKTLFDQSENTYNLELIANM